MKLGLRKGEIMVCQHDPEWMVEAERICHKIKKQAGSQLVDIQHVGSTSIPGMPAKPILDFVVGVLDMDDLDGLVSSLVQMGYIDRGLGPGSIGYVLVFEVAEKVRTQHIHIVEHTSEHWLHYIDFRDDMRNNEDDNMRFKELKELLIRSNVNRKEYQSQKSEFVSKIWAKIIAQQGGAPDAFGAGDL